MTNYLELLRVKHGYRSLKQRYFEILPANPIEEKDRQIASLEKALEDCKMQVSDYNALKDLGEILKSVQKQT